MAEDVSVETLGGAIGYSGLNTGETDFKNIDLLSHQHQNQLWDCLFKGISRCPVISQTMCALNFNTKRVKRWFPSVLDSICIYQSFGNQGFWSLYNSPLRMLHHCFESFAPRHTLWCHMVPLFRFHAGLTMGYRWDDRWVTTLCWLLVEEIRGLSCSFFARSPANLGFSSPEPCCWELGEDEWLAWTGCVVSLGWTPWNSCGHGPILADRCRIL